MSLSILTDGKLINISMEFDNCTDVNFGSNKQKKGGDKNERNL